MIAGNPRLTAELSALWKIALPLVAAGLAEYAMFQSTKLVVGREGYQELAAVGLVGDLGFELAVVLIGFLSVVGVLIAQAEGAGDRAAVGHVTRQGLLVANCSGFPAQFYCGTCRRSLPGSARIP